jgi:methyl-accepting chemotaxis protein
MRTRKNYMKDMNIGKKLKVGYGILMGLLAIIAVAALIGIISLNSSIKSLVSKAEKADEAIKVCRIDTNIAARNVREMALNTNKSTHAEYKQEFEDDMNDLSEQLKVIKASGVVSEELYQQYVDGITSWANDAYDIIGKIEAGQVEEATRLIFSNCVPALDGLGEVALEMNDTIDAEIEAGITRCRVVFYSCVAVIIVMTVASLWFAILISNATRRSITEPLSQIEVCAKELVEGNLHTELEWESEDELGKLADNLRTAISTISTYVDDISMAMDEFSQGNFDVQPAGEWKGDFMSIYESVDMFERKMADTVKGIQKVAKDVEQDAEQVSSTSMELAQGATDQASVMEEFTATIETVSDEVSSNAEYTKRISKQVESVGGEISATSDRMNDMVESMNAIEASSQQIRTIIDTISDVASQTSLLALNASIEAARAGESGRGFAVVANQVTALAAKTAEAVKESTKLIDDSMAEVAKGMQITEEIANQQSVVAENTRGIVEEVNNIAETLDGQREAFLQLNEGVNQINSVVQTNSATSQQCAASSQEMSGQADILEKLIAKFRVASANA